ncbi:MAG: polymorphic toxin-type HINT domain-containing protein [Lentihominibacter sp.]|uniref:polymorphic toxin-type HINT domain-containing protein n=1 Tax=Lentihominibacter sp. TaxID=2944216 RepID=UPI002A910D43|nr:polymorphic toxin-type HINT domain-containing protein [Lentihominibacter sp.]MDY5286184.1 polymorphic toxin-type HINT domain-containing protein [Lentihominibacter sp.]
MWSERSERWIWGVVGAAMGAYDGYKYAKKKGYKGWKKYAAIAGGAALGVVNPFKVFKVARTGYKTYKAVKYSKKARAAYKATKVTKKAKAKPKHTVVMKKNTKAKIQSKPAVRNSKGIKKLQKSAGGTIGCFTAGTKIHTKDGFKAIENIKAGDYVWSENPETHEKALKKVKKIFVREKDSVVRLSINGEAIETTNEHPFYVEGHGWTNAYDLKAGDKVRLEDGTTGTVEKTKHVALDTPVTVYNFEVEDFHTYYVSEQKVLVHNTCAATAKNTQVAKSSNNYVSSNDTKALPAPKSKSYMTGAEGEEELKQLVGGKSQKHFSTSIGGRFVDQYSNNIAHEAKVGYVPLTKRIRTQVEKDAELMRNGDIEGAHWHFFRSGVTGKIGPSAPLRNLLEEHGIKYTIYE